MKCMLVDDSKISQMILKKIICTAHPNWEITEVETAEILRPLFLNSKIAFLTANIQQSIQKLASDLRIDFIPKLITEAKITNYVG